MDNEGFQAPCSFRANSRVPEPSETIPRAQSLEDTLRDDKAKSPALFQIVVHGGVYE